MYKHVQAISSHKERVPSIKKEIKFICSEPQNLSNTQDGSEIGGGHLVDSIRYYHATPNIVSLIKVPTMSTTCNYRYYKFFLIRPITKKLN